MRVRTIRWKNCAGYADAAIAERILFAHGGLVTRGFEIRPEGYPYFDEVWKIRWTS